MPIYEYLCDCGQEWEMFQRGAIDTSRCPSCGKQGRQQISLPAAIRPDCEPYYDVGLGHYITSRAHRRRVMHQQGAVEVGSSRLHGARGTIFSFPGRSTMSVSPSGAYAKPDDRVWNHSSTRKQGV